MNDEEIEEWSESRWKEVIWDDCLFCGDTLEAFTRLSTPGQFYDCDKVRCIGDCNKEVGVMNCDGDTAHVMFDEE